MKQLIPWRKQNREISQIRKNFDELFDWFLREPLFPHIRVLSDDTWFPTVDVIEGEKDITVNAEIPGVEQKNIDVSLDGRFLTIKGEKKYEKEESDEHYHRVESSRGFYKRTIELPTDVDHSKVDAKYKNGILKIKLIKAKEGDVKRIKIKTN